ncbi:hypothetical protein SCP_1400400 [Sparassis crispa]|uniref:Uncharacterized protein n=1 Tax=Sparassis crispa TaxID=139825 RepID=A0A401H2H4_9APHY|nr:hypothetical protein SCP_1400400 [Sparassis crispa]GBE88635.1 hypothetical protein SCP_1400400 [Sparassis crispa]
MGINLEALDILVTVHGIGHDMDIGAAPFRQGLPRFQIAYGINTLFVLFFFSSDNSLLAV